jgi:undecaprenyl-phosphate 4-deoxy-4-formamido-L-arabinose transferase
MIEPSISVVVPVYNSEFILFEFAARLEPVLSGLTRHFELILVNDGSYDRSWEVICHLAQKHEWVLGINLMRNYGQHNALLCGIRAAKYSVIVTMDDDLQHPPEEIPKLLDKLAEGHDVVYGTPRKLPHSLWRNLLSIFTKWAMANAMGLKTVRHISAFRVFRTHLRKAFARYQSPNLLLDVLLAWGTTRFTSIEVNHEPRRVGKSNYTPLKLFNQTMMMLTGFSTTPLRLASLIGFTFTVFGILLFVYVLIQYFRVGSLPGFPFLASIISLFSGIQAFMLGIMGEYLARMFKRSMECPTYVISRKTEHLVEGQTGIRTDE